MRLIRVLCLALAAGVCLDGRSGGLAAELPNILWITCEDTGPQLGCYGDAYAKTPNLDRLAARGMRYVHAWSNAPVCAPARTAIITGVYPTSLGAEHMRSLVAMPPGMKLYPQFLRERGYYCTNNSKEDYNVEKPGTVWDQSSAKAHWKNRRPGQPFFAVFNFTITHESQIRTRPYTPQHDPAKVRVPAYHPDTPEVRLDWAQYYDRITEMDAQAGRRLRELDEAGLAENTIVFFYGDHGSGMPRSKRWPYNSGLHVPLIVYVPEKFKHLAPKEYVPGGTSRRLAAFVDLAPTVLSLAGIKPPEWMQGRALMGPFESPPPAYAFGFRGRMDERYDMVRSVTNGRYIYVRQYMPHLIYGQYLSYMFQTPTTREWRRLYDEGKLAPPKTFFWEPKPAEELYDLQADRDEVHNLADSPGHEAVLAELRQALRKHLLETRDVGFLPEAEMHRRAAGTTMYEFGHDPKRYPLETILAMAELAARRTPDDVPKLREGLKAADSGVRYWAATGLLIRGAAAVAAARQDLRAALRDESPSVRIAAAWALG
ncbi:MAG: sulfatase-like hydrolase/transferase, partial [Thermoguttaceae bacterium]|nr:sulfatase-like hydrolase/transferase [Thermoguttaceae bacterium]